MISKNKILLGALVILVIGILSFKYFDPISPVILWPAMLASMLGLPSFITISLGFLPLLTCFLLWSKFYLKPPFIIVEPTVLLTIFLIVGSITYNISSYKYGIKYQGEFYTLLMYGLNFLCIVFLAITFKVNNSNPKSITSLSYNIILFSWLGLVAFPYFGESL